MAKYLVTHGKATDKDGKEFVVGAVLEMDSVPPSLNGKVKLADDQTFEVATPEPKKRGRPAAE